MGKQKSFKAKKRNFEKEISQLMRKQAREEKYKAEKAARAQKPSALEAAGTSVGVTTQGRTS